MSAFEYRNGMMHCEDAPLKDVADVAGTPTFVYSLDSVISAYKRIDKAFEQVPHLICYSMKANSNLALCKALASIGAGADIVSGGELYRAMKGGVSPRNIVYSGVGKTSQEIRFSLESDILMFNIESEAELAAINAIAGEMGLVARIAVRVNPEIDARTHPYITTGMRKYKFGIPATDVVRVYKQALEMPNIDPVGIQFHLGSQLVHVQPLVEAAEKLADLAGEVTRAGVRLRYIDVGGGLGIRYRDEAPEGPDALAQGIVPIVNALKCTLVLEPGRYILGAAGALLTRVVYTKKNDVKKFAIVDAAMNDLIRPTLYDAYHEIKPVAEKSGWEMVDVVGPICESGDFFAHDRQMPAVSEGDLVAILGAGAYGFTMSSNYNSRPRAAEVVVSGSEIKIARKRETYEDLVRGEDL